MSPGLTPSAFVNPYISSKMNRHWPPWDTMAIGLFLLACQIALACFCLPSVLSYFQLFLLDSDPEADLIPCAIGSWFRSLKPGRNIQSRNRVWNLRQLPALLSYLPCLQNLFYAAASDTLDQLLSQFLTWIEGVFSLSLVLFLSTAWVNLKVPWS